MTFRNFSFDFNPQAVFPWSHSISASSRTFLFLLFFVWLVLNPVYVCRGKRPRNLLCTLSVNWKLHQHDLWLRVVWQQKLLLSFTLSTVHCETFPSTFHIFPLNFLFIKSSLINFFSERKFSKKFSQQDIFSIFLSHDSRRVQLEWILVKDWTVCIVFFASLACALSDSQQWRIFVLYYAPRVVCCVATPYAHQHTLKSRANESAPERREVGCRRSRQRYEENTSEQHFCKVCLWVVDVCWCEKHHRRMAKEETKWKKRKVVENSKWIIKWKKRKMHPSINNSTGREKEERKKYHTGVKRVS